MLEENKIILNRTWSSTYILSSTFAFIVQISPYKIGSLWCCLLHELAFKVEWTKIIFNAVLFDSHFTNQIIILSLVYYYFYSTENTNSWLNLQEINVFFFKLTNSSVNFILIKELQNVKNSKSDILCLMDTHIKV